MNCFQGFKSQMPALESYCETKIEKLCFNDSKQKITQQQPFQFQKQQKDVQNQNTTSKEACNLHYGSFGEKNLSIENKRQMVYCKVSKKLKDNDLDYRTLEQNNYIFEMVFLNKSKLKKKLSAQESFQNIQTKQNRKSPNIYQFQLHQKLGSGKFGNVFLARHKKTGFLCALKKINKKNISHKLAIQLIREIKFQLFLNHPNIAKLYTFFIDGDYLYLVMELCYSGQLLTFLKKKEKLSEILTKVILKDILAALQQMHKNQIIHRDLKPENIIIHSGMIKICDFGWSVSSKSLRETFCGTPLYVSPQLLKSNHYDNKIDIWSLGILAYELLFGHIPFDILTEKDFRKIVEDEIKFSNTTPISSEAKDFIQNCLKKNPIERSTVAELLKHPFIANIKSFDYSEMY